MGNRLSSESIVISACFTVIGQALMAITSARRRSGLATNAGDRLPSCGVEVMIASQREVVA